jgi:hypothetical protein
LQWLVEAAEQLQAFTRYFLCDVHVTSNSNFGFAGDLRLLMEADFA